MSTAEPVRVLFVANDPPGSAVCRYRCEHLAAALPSSRFAAEVVYVGASRVRVEHDVVVLHRICAVAEGRAFAAAARACGATLVYGADDLVWDAEAFEGNHPAADRLRRYAPLHAEMLRAADAILVSTDFLAARAQQAANSAGKPVYVVRNFLSDEQLRVAELARPPRTTGCVTLAYLSGTATHDTDLAHIAAPLAAVFAARPEVDLLLVGPVALPVAWEPFAARIRRLPFVPWRELPIILAGVDINLAPLAPDRLLNSGKSEIKLLEAGASGVPTLASAVGGFAEVCPPQFLAASPDDWFTRLNEWIANPAARQTAGEAAHAFVHQSATTAAHAPHVAAVFDALSALPRPACKGDPHRRAKVVNYPFSPKYAAKAALKRVRAIAAATSRI